MDPLAASRLTLASPVSNPVQGFVGPNAVVLVPSHWPNEPDEVVAFPAGTTALFVFMRDRAPSGLDLALAVVPDDYKEYAQHDATIDIAKMVVGYVVLPFVVNAIYDWARARLGGGLGNLRSQLTVQRSNGAWLDLRYDGPVEEYVDAIREAVKGLDDESSDNPL